MQKILSEILNEEIVSLSFVGGGCIANSQIITSANNSKYFLKQYSSGDVNLKEANGLRELKKANVIKVPEVIYCDDHFLILEFIQSSSKTKNFSENFGRAFAKLHKYNSDKYGFYENNFIGSTPQINLPQSTNWTDFYFQNRLKFQFELAEKNRYTDSRLKNSFNFLETNIHKIISEEEEPSLLHGDLWGGNYIIDENGEACLIDPAVYYGNREADLAMTKIFGGFDSKFYSAYNEEFPLKPGWEYRENIYKLYHILNHLNLFGAGYYSQVINLIRYYQ